MKFIFLTLLANAAFKHFKPSCLYSEMDFIDIKANDHVNKNKKVSLKGQSI